MHDFSSGVDIGESEANITRLCTDYNSYDDIISEYRKYVDLMFENEDDARESTLLLGPSYGINPEIKSDHWETMRLEMPLAVFDIDGTKVSERKLNYGYVMKDLNNDGKDELILLSNGAGIRAVFTMIKVDTDWKPFLIDAFWSRYKCHISKDGFITINSSGGLSGKIFKCQLSEDGRKLNFIEKLEYSAPQYYSYEKNGHSKEISEDEFNIFKQGMWSDEYDHIIDCSTYGLEFIPLFEE